MHANHGPGPAHEIPMRPAIPPAEIQDKLDEYIRNTHVIINNPDKLVDETTEQTLRLGLSIMDYYRQNLKELDFYRMKFTKVPPIKVELSQIKKCYIGECKCGQLLLESRDKCCPRCSQFVLWPKRPKD